MLVPNLFVANGVASFVMNYLRNLNHDEVQVDIASYKEGDSVYYAEVEAAGGKMFFLPGIKNLPEHVKVCNKILSDGRYDIIHDNTLHISIPMMWCAKRQVFRYGFCTAIIQKWERHLLKRSEIVFSSSAAFAGDKLCGMFTAGRPCNVRRSRVYGDSECDSNRKISL